MQWVTPELWCLHMVMTLGLLKPFVAFLCNMLCNKQSCTLAGLWLLKSCIHQECGI